MKKQRHLSTTLGLTLIFALTLSSCGSDHYSGYTDSNRWQSQPSPGWNAQGTESYSEIVENEFMTPKEAPLSTFAIDVDGASYANTRRILREGSLPTPDAIRTEEFVNYFHYEYPQPQGNDPFSITTELSVAPWNPDHQLVHIGLQGKEIQQENLPPSNLVFLIDVSGSMSEPAKLPLLKEAFKMLAEQLRPQDRVAIAVYAGAAGLVLPSTPGDRKFDIYNALTRLEAGGGTAGAEGIELAYEVAKANFIPNGNNRVILATDGDFNIGMSSPEELDRLIVRKRDEGVFLTVLGFGSGNYKDDRMQTLAQNGNGNASYIDNILEAHKVLISEFGGTLFTIAKDVKVQVEFNPAHVKGYRLVGYESRLLDAEDFNDDRKDAGELGAGHSVTALYEIIPAHSNESVRGVDGLKYQPARSGAEAGLDATTTAFADELLTVKLRYKAPDGESSKKLVRTVAATQVNLDETSQDFRFAAAAAEFALLLRDSEFKGQADFDQVIDLARGALGPDPEGYRGEFVSLVKQAKLLHQPTIYSMAEE